MKKFQLALLALFLLLYACKEEEIITQGNFYVPKNQPPTLLWQLPLNVDTLSALAVNPLIYNNGVMFSGERMTFIDTVHVFMVDTGDQHFIWQTNNAFNNDCLSISFTWGGQRYVYGNLFATLCGGSPRVLDLNIGNVLWDYSLPNGDVNITGWNSLLFHTQLNGGGPFTRSSLMVSDIAFSDWDTIISLPMENGYSSHIYPPSVMQNDNNDTLLFFQNRQWTSTPSYDGKIDLYGYNLSADSIIWEQDDIDIQGNSCIYPPLIYQDKIYFKGGFTIYCLDTESGTILWSWLAENGAGDLLMSDLIIEEEKLLVKTSGNYLYALNPETGTIIWKNTECGSTPFSLAYFNGVIYNITGNDGKLRAYDINDGHQYWVIESPNVSISPTYNNFFVNNVAIDSQSRKLYVADKYFLMCFQLN